MPLVLNSNLHSGRPNSLNDAKVADLAAHLRARFAPGKQAWTGLERRVAVIRGVGR